MTDYHDNPLTEQESAMISAVLEEFKTHFLEDELENLEMFEYNDDYVDLQITYKDGYEESMAFERDLLLSGKTVDEIINWIQ